MLTKKQQELLILIHERIAECGVPPSFDEMKDSIGLKSKSGIHRLISALVERGFLERLPNKARALNVLKLPEGYHPKETDKTEVAQKARLVHNLDDYSLDTQKKLITAVPLCGKIAAGTPIEAISHEGNTIDVPLSMLGKGEHYALVVEGDSMIEAGIQDEDVVLIRKTDSVRNDDIVVALVDQQEATLKRIRLRGQHIDLIPENRNYEIRTYESGRVQIQGKLAGLFRQY